MTYSTYTNTGAFTNGATPGISAAFLNSVETFLDKLWSDTLITSDAAGGLSVVKANLSTGSLKRLSIFTASVASGNNTVTHGLSVKPDIVLLTFNLTSTPVAATIGYDHAGRGATTITVYSSVATNIIGLALCTVT